MQTTTTTPAEDARRALDLLIYRMRTVADELEAVAAGRKAPAQMDSEVGEALDYADRSFGFTVPSDLRCCDCGLVRWALDLNENGECPTCAVAAMLERACEEEACGLL